MPRSRTGCMTCRQRKLKCDENRPICSNCSKANRSCVPASTITFRHQQNPSMNSNQESLKNFYGYKETFAEAAQWLPVSKDLTWIHTSNPYDDHDEDDREHHQHGNEAASTHLQRGPGPNELSQADYATFTEGLAALSAVASQDQYNLAASLAPLDHTPMQDSSSSPRHSQAILNPPPIMGPPDEQLDPQLQMLDDPPYPRDPPSLAPRIPHP